jgi:hypothetical protein
MPTKHIVFIRPLNLFRLGGNHFVCLEHPLSIVLLYFKSAYIYTQAFSVTQRKKLRILR